MANKKGIDEVWEKAKPIRGQNRNIYRKDDYGNKIRSLTERKVTKSNKYPYKK